MPSEPRNPGVAIERSDVSAPLIAILAAGITLFVGLSALAILWLFPLALREPSDAPRSASAEPRLQVNPAGDLAAQRAAERGALDGYGWIDRQRGVVRIPIDQAMRDVAAAGIADWPKDAK